MRKKGEQGSRSEWSDRVDGTAILCRARVTQENSPVRAGDRMMHLALSRQTWDILVSLSMNYFN